MTGISQVVLGDLVLCKEVLPTVVWDSSEHEDGFNDGDNSVLDLSDELPSEENVQLVKVSKYYDYYLLQIIKYSIFLLLF